MTWKSQRHFSEEAFLQATFREFTKFWGSGKRARIFVESMNGGVFVSFSLTQLYSEGQLLRPLEAFKQNWQFYLIALVCGHQIYDL